MAAADRGSPEYEWNRHIKRLLSDTKGHHLSVHYARRGDCIKVGSSANPVKRCIGLGAQLLATEPGGRRVEGERLRQLTPARRGSGVNEPCILAGPNCGGGFKGRGMCRRHYERWCYGGKPDVIDGVEIPERLTQQQLSPNPWLKVVPPCPHCSSSRWVFLWANEGTLRWFCQPCRRRFDIAEEIAA